MVSMLQSSIGFRRTTHGTTHSFRQGLYATVEAFSGHSGFNIVGVEGEVVTVVNDCLCNC